MPTWDSFHYVWQLLFFILCNIPCSPYRLNTSCRHEIQSVRCNHPLISITIPNVSAIHYVQYIIHNILDNVNCFRRYAELHQQHGIHKVCQYLSNIKHCSILTENTSIFFRANYNLVIFAFETSLIFTLKIQNMWEKQLHAC